MSDLTSKTAITHFLMITERSKGRQELMCYEGDYTTFEQLSKKRWVKWDYTSGVCPPPHPFITVLTHESVW